MEEKDIAEVRRRLQRRSDTELLNIIDAEQGLYEPEAIAAVREEIARRGDEGVLRKRIAALDAALAQQSTETGSSANSGDGNESSPPEAFEGPLGSRYADAYSVARSLVVFGTIVKFAGVGIGILTTGVLLQIFPPGSQGGPGRLLIGVAVGLAIGLIGYGIGIHITAQGQLIRASIDLAVNTSPLLRRASKARIIGVS